MKLNYGDTAARIVSGRIADSAADQPTLAAYGQAGCAPNMVCLKADDSTLWQYAAASTAIASGDVIVPADARAAGRWVRVNSPESVAGVVGVHVVDLATTAALPAGTATAQTFTVTATGTLTIDSVVTTLNQRVLVKNQVATQDNGIYLVTTVGAGGVAAVLTRASDANSIADYQPGMLVATGPAGTANASLLYEQTSAAPATLHTSAITFGLAATAIVAGSGLSLSGSTLSSKNAGAAGTGLTDTATQSIDVAGGTWRTLATLSQNGALTLATTGSPAAGDKITITRNDASAHTYSVINGGAGAGTLLVMPNSKVNFGEFQFDGTNWALRSCGTQ